MKNSGYAVRFPAARCATVRVGALPQPGSDSVDTSRPSGARRGHDQGAQADQIVGRRGEGEHPAHGRSPAMPELAPEPDHLAPAKDFLHPFTFPLTHRVAGVPRRPSVDGALVALRMYVGTEVRRHVAAAEGGREGVGIVALVGP